MIKQIINKSQIVQTGLAIEVDGIRVDYYRIPDKLKITAGVLVLLKLVIL